MRSREDNHICLQNSPEAVPATPCEVHCPLWRADTLGQCRLPAGKPPTFQFTSLHTAHTACERRLKPSDKCIVRSIVRSLWVATLNEVEAKHSYFHLPQPRYDLIPSWFSSLKPPWKIIVFMRQRSGESQLQFKEQMQHMYRDAPYRQLCSWS